MIGIPQLGIYPVSIVPFPGDGAPWQTEHVERIRMRTAMYAVEGVVCDSCISAVLENVQSLSGVSVVAMDLVTGGESPLLVTSGTKLGADAVRDAVERVGFGLVSRESDSHR